MKNQLEELRQSNNKLDQQLSKENNAILTDMVCYLKSSDLREYEIEVIRKDLTGMALETQLRNEKFSDIAGDDYKELCDELIKNGSRKSFCEKALELLYVLAFGVGILYFAEIIFTSTIINIFKYGQFSMPITSGFLISTLAAVGMGFGIYYYFTKMAFALSAPGHKTKVLFIIGFTVIWAALVVIRVFLGKTVLFHINCLYPLLFFVIAFTVIKFLSNRYTNH